MSIQRLKSVAHAAGYAMAVPTEYLDEQQPRLLALEAPPAERPAYRPHKQPQPEQLLLEYHGAASVLHNWFDALRGGRATA